MDDQVNQLARPACVSSHLSDGRKILGKPKCISGLERSDKKEAERLTCMPSRLPKGR